MSFLRIVVPVLNEGETLGPRLNALRPLRDRGAELVVVDGGSTDETWAVATAFADRVLFAPQGRGSQMNAGAVGSSAEVLLFLHADTVLPPAADDLIHRALDRGGQWGRFDLRIDGSHPLLRPTEHLINLRSRLTGIATGDQAIFIRRKMFERLGGFADLPLMEDVELSRRFRRIGRPARVSIPVVTSGRRWTTQGVLRTILLMWGLRARYFFGADPRELADRYGYSHRPMPAAAGLAILAKAPVPGLAKTRLIPALGAAGAARAQRCFTRAAVQMAGQAGLRPAALWCAPDPAHPFFRALRARTSIDLLSQCAGDLGLRMTRAMEHHFAGHPVLPLLIIGTDCPMLAPGHLQQAARALSNHDVVVIPAEDGGYVLIGMRKPVPEVFEDIAWSTVDVMEQTRQRLRAVGASWCELEPLWDVDHPADWQRLQRVLDFQPESSA
jgi:rSAM/selenodomain-associated transferase 2/rSAM/selenodomain-associated transferase 1